MSSINCVATFFTNYPQRKMDGNAYENACPYYCDYLRPRFTSSHTHLFSQCMYILYIKRSAEVFFLLHFLELFTGQNVFPPSLPLPTRMCITVHGETGKIV